MDSMNVHASAIAGISQAGGGSGGYGIVGLDSVSMSGNAKTDSYNSSNGVYTSSSAGTAGSVYSNGNITLSGNATVNGDAQPGIGKTVKMSGNADVTGSTTTQTSAMEFNDASLPSSYTSGGSFSKSGNGSTTLTAGNYYYSSFSLSGNHTLQISGKVTVYVNGNVSLSGTVNTGSNLPSNFEIRVLASSSSVAISGNGSLYADVYAPKSSLSISGNGNFYGRFVGKSFTVSGNGKLHYDTAISSAPSNLPASTTIALID